MRVTIRKELLLPKAHKRRCGGILAGLLLVGLLMLRGGSALAVEFEVGEVRGYFDTTISTGASLRVSDRDSALIGVANGGAANSINGDNGNLNYGKGDFTSAAAKVNHELDANWRNFGLFGRFFYFYDTIIMNSDTDRTPLSPEAEERSGRNIELRDLYLDGDFDVGEMPLSIRVGNQVVSWGESTFIQNGINVINPVDVSKFRVAGAELRDGLEPVPIVDASLGLTDNFSIEGFYQVLWDHTEIDPEGTFFSTSDLASPGGNFVFLGFGQPPVSDNPPTIGPTAITGFGSSVPRAADRDADDQGQFGVALRYFAPALNDTEFGLYYIRHHSRLPLISARTGTLAGLGGGDYASSARYFIEYPEDIDLIGASFNAEIGSTGIALQGEVSYRKDQPLQIDDVELLLAALTPAGDAVFTPAGNPFRLNQVGAFGFGEDISGFRRKDVVQSQATMTKVLGPTFGSDQVVLLGEAGFTYIHNMEDKSVLRYEGPGTFTSGTGAFTALGIQPATQEGGFADPFSWGYRLLARATFNNAVGPVNLVPQIAFAHDVNGTTPSPIGNFVSGRKAVTLSLGANYLSSLRASLSYTNFFGGGAFNLINDRDFVSLSVNYSF